MNDESLRELEKAIAAVRDYETCTDTAIDNLCDLAEKVVLEQRAMRVLEPPPLWMFGDSVEARNALQKSGKVHPMTCGNNRGDEAHRKYAEEHGEDWGQLIATEEGWKCPVCEYTQPLRR